MPGSVCSGEKRTHRFKQINGTLELTVNNGTQFKIKFPINQEYVGYK